MKRELFFEMFAAAGMLLAMSCSDGELGITAQTEEEQGTTEQQKNEVQVTFTIGLEESIGTRVIADGESIDKLVYAVFDEEGSAIIQKTEKNIGQFPAEITVTLTTDHTYKVAFWAQDADCKAYTIDDDMNVTVSYDGENNDDGRDAFYTAKAFSVSGSTSIEITLRRPFAQINACVTEDDWNKAVETGITITQSSMTVESVGTSIDLFTGKVSGSATATFSPADIPSEDIAFDTIDMSNDGASGTTYKWLSMSYILVNDGSNNGSSRAVLDNLVFNFTPDSGDAITVELTDVGVQRNYRTNVLGVLGEALIDDTSDGTITIYIDSSFDGDNFTYPDYTDE